MIAIYVEMEILDSEAFVELRVWNEESTYYRVPSLPLYSPFFVIICLLRYGELSKVPSLSKLGCLDVVCRQCDLRVPLEP